ncbi:excisionase [Bacillus canaveralius]|uniref:Excisionase n=1 Tax=Bacillus canaveralius TaxID=1403243 RepID=A0A2N5GM06_9BACI|nr:MULTISPECIES: helix-turn-helix transcriptional regulator [Bacillus]PLR82896.1 excisionase [Bacillus canaveralius]PLR85266.1 excisionase [Bacillus sp. V33-4]PLR97099.1 excisionase [Bacillus canaveralius]
MDQELFTANDVAEILKISKHTVYELIKRGELRAFKVGNKMRIEADEVERYKTMVQTFPAITESPDQRMNGALQLSGSHDFLVEYLVKHVSKRNSKLSLQPAYIGSLEGLMSLYRGFADIAAIHLLDPSSGMYNLPIIKQLFVYERITVIRLASREQGLMIARNNPNNISGLADVARKDISIVNRQKGSGTRFSLDYLLSLTGIDPASVNGYDNEEWTHLSAASYISKGLADTAFGIRAAADQLNLDFIPITTEPFDLVFRWKSENTPFLEQLIEIIQTQDFKDTVIHLSGYDFSELGKMIYQF